MHRRSRAFALAPSALLALLALQGCTRAQVTPPPRPALANAPIAVAAPIPAASPTTGPAVAPEPAGGAEDPTAEGGDVDDEIESEGADAVSPSRAPKSPKITLTDEEILDRLRKDPASLGPMSVGLANAGALVNGVQMPKGEHWTLLDPGNAWGTQETVDFLSRSIAKVADQHPGAHPVLIGHISGKRGGYLSPHKSHQSGRDVDVGYYHTGDPPRWFYRATEGNLDAERSWALVKALITDTEVEMIFIDILVQRMLYDYALKHGEDQAWLDSVFQCKGKSARPTIRHVKGHANHLHVRFYNPMAQEMARRAHIHFRVAPPIPELVYAQHKARSGDTLVILARRYGTTIEAIQAANGIRGTALRAGVVYKIPQKAAPKPQAQARAQTPARRGPTAKSGPPPKPRR